jgi:hypothetical protein
MGRPQQCTPKMYTNYFWRWLQYFGEMEVTQPAALRREHVINYFEWRKKHGGERNTAIHEIKFLGMLMDYQVVRLRQSQVPLSCIDFRRRIIDYPRI